jgi:hypothetical protein
VLGNDGPTFEGEIVEEKGDDIKNDDTQKVSSTENGSSTKIFQEDEGFFDKILPMSPAVLEEITTLFVNSISSCDLKDYKIMFIQEICRLIRKECTSFVRKTTENKSNKGKETPTDTEFDLEEPTLDIIELMTILRKSLDKIFNGSDNQVKEDLLSLMFSSETNNHAAVQVAKFAQTLNSNGVGLGKVEGNESGNNVVVTPIIDFSHAEKEAEENQIGKNEENNNLAEPPTDSNDSNIKTLIHLQSTRNKTRSK